jgi:hypothetical protein
MWLVIRTNIDSRIQTHWYTVQFYTNQEWRPSC